MDIRPKYQTIEAVQIINENRDKGIIVNYTSKLESLITSKTGLLTDVYQMYNKFICEFAASTDNPEYTLIFYTNDYLIWDEDRRRFLVLPEFQFLLMYKE